MLRTRTGALYTGITTDVARRVAEHQAQGPRCARALRGRAPLVLVFTTEIGAHGRALRAEWAVKRLTKLAKEQLVKRQCSEAVLALIGSGDHGPTVS